MYNKFGYCAIMFYINRQGFFLFLKMNCIKRNYDLPSNISIEQKNGKLFWQANRSSSNYKLASSSLDYEIRVWDLNTNRPVKELKSNYNSVSSLTILPNNEKIIVAGSDDKKIRLISIGNGICNGTLIGHNSSVKSLLVLKSGYLASGSHKTIKVWDLNQLICIQTLNGHTRTILCLAQMKSIDEIASGSWDGTIKLWNYKIGVCLKTLTGHENSIMCLSVLCHSIVSSSYDSTIKIWKTDKSVITLRGHSKCVSCLVILNAKTIISSSYDKSIKFWDLNLNVCIKTFYDHHSSSILCMTFIMETSQIYTGSLDCRIKALNLNKGKCQKEFPNINSPVTNLVHFV